MKRGRSPARTCEAWGCFARTNDGKPYCLRHVLRMPYAGAVAKRLEREAKGEEMPKNGTKEAEAAAADAVALELEAMRRVADAIEGLPWAAAERVLRWALQARKPTGEPVRSWARLGKRHGYALELADLWGSREQAADTTAKGTKIVEVEVRALGDPEPAK